MGTVLTIVIIVVVVLAAVAALFMYQRKRSQELQGKFGPEYERTLDESGDRRSAERELRGRERRVSKLDIVPLSRASAVSYRDEWAQIQQSFVDQPGAAVADADQLVLRMMRETGYPVDEFDQRVNDISVEHPQVATHYREAHRVAVAQARGETDTEELRQAVTSYRALVDALLSDSDKAAAEATDRGRRDAQPTDAKEHKA
jgi:FtsZ-interacting cell division protein ZipA